MFGSNLKSLRKARKITQVQLAAMLNLDKSSIAKYETAGVMPSPELLLKIFRIFDVPVDFLLSGDKKSTSKGIPIPVLGRVQAGTPVEAAEDIIDYEEIEPEVAAAGEYFGLQIRGESMQPRMWDGDVVIVRRQTDVDSGSVAVVLVNGKDATVKKIIKTGNSIMLMPLNSSYEPTVYTAEEIETLPVMILGKVVEVRGKLM